MQLYYASFFSNNLILGVTIISVASSPYATYPLASEIKPMRPEKRVVAR
jgi:hypothetical protein